MPLNKFIAHCGICSRRDAAEMVKLGKVKVNNETITEPGHKVSAKDEIRVNGKKISLRQKPCLHPSQ
jgi:23S rRNA pseudouridine2605 synthase